jgi:hypothetical protein
MPSIINFSIDLNNQQAPEPLPVREYRGSIRSANVKLSQKGTKYAEVAFFVSSDQYPADYKDGNPDGTTIMYRRVSLEDTPNARFGTRRFIEAIGAPLGKKIDVAEWVGREAAVEVSHELYEGVNRAVIARVRAA